MNTLSNTARLISAACAAAVTLTLLSGVIAMAEPQRSVLIAKSQGRDAVPASEFRLATVAPVAGRSVK